MFESLPLRQNARRTVLAVRFFMLREMRRRACIDCQMPCFSSAGKRFLFPVFFISSNLSKAATSASLVLPVRRRYRSVAVIRLCGRIFLLQGDACHAATGRRPNALEAEQMDNAAQAQAVVEESRVRQRVAMPCGGKKSALSRK